MAHIDITHGSEGPAHDPYAYEEINFTMTDGVKVVYHGGLVEWCEVHHPQGVMRSHSVRGIGAFRHRTNDVLIRGENDDAAPLFEKWTGVHPEAAISLHNRIERRRQSKCSICGSRKLEWTPGYPGEHLLVCSKCDRIVDSTFHESEII